MLLQSNHRSWADFYLDVVATDGNAQMLSRMMVALAFPMFMGAVCVIRSVVLFQRNRKHDKEARAYPKKLCLKDHSAASCACGVHGQMGSIDALGSSLREAFSAQAFNAMIDRKMAASPVDGLIVYPEGERPAPAEAAVRHKLCLQNLRPAGAARRSPEHTEAFSAPEEGHAALCLRSEASCSGGTLTSPCCMNSLLWSACASSSPAVALCITIACGCADCDECEQGGCDCGERVVMQVGNLHKILGSLRSCT